VTVTATNNIITGGFIGVFGANSGTSTTQIVLRGNVISGSNSANVALGVAPGESGAVYASGAGITISLDANTISGNTVGINNGGNGSIIKTFGNNQLEANTTAIVGALTSTTGQ
jgi:hypothetical protein